MKRVLSVLLLLLFCLPAGAEEKTMLLFDHCFGGAHPAWAAFHARHPEVAWAFSNSDYQDAEALLLDIQAGTFDADLFRIYSFYDYRKLIEKGACLELTDVPGVAEAVSGMLPAVREQAMQDGKIYALPDSIGFDYWTINREHWEAAGLDGTPVPDSLPALFDSLENWAVRYRQTGPSKFRVIAFWDGSVFSASAYARQFIRWAVDSALLQKAYQKEPVRLDADLIPLLERARQIGIEIYEAEREAILRDGFDGAKGLLETGLQMKWPDLRDVLFMRTDETHPKLIRGMLNMAAVSAASEHQALAKELMGDAAQYVRSPKNQFLFQDAMESDAAIQSMVCFMGGNAVSSGKGLEAYQTLENRFARGDLTAEQFVSSVQELLALEWQAVEASGVY